MREKSIKNKFYKTNSRGISLVVLVITIVVMLILTTTLVLTVAGESGIIESAKEASFKTDLGNIKDEYKIYCADKNFDELGKFEKETLTSSVDILVYNGKIQEGETIFNILPSIKDSKYRDKVEIIKGEMYVTADSDYEEKWIEEMGLKVNPYIIVDGVLMSADQNLMLLDEEGTVVIPSSAKVIGEGAFANVEGLKKIIIPGTIKEIGRNAFARNATLETVIIQDGVEIIGETAFYSCTNLKEVQMANTITNILGSAFMNCTSLVNINLSDSLEVIESYVFSSCSLLNEVVIPSNVKQINSSAFSNCISLEKISLSENLQTMGVSVFSNCPKLVDVVIPVENSYFAFENGILFNKEKTEMKLILKTAISETTFTVPNTVIKLEPGLINNYTQINKIEIPESVSTIDIGFFTKYISEINIDENNQSYTSDENAIYDKDKTTLVLYYTNTENVIVEEGIKVLGVKAFEYCDKLTTIELPESLEVLKSYPFNACYNLKELKLGKNINSLNSLSLYNSGITNLEIDNENTNYTVEDRILYNKDKTKLITTVYPIGTLESLVIPYGVVEIEHYAFHNQYNMTSITIPETVTKIGDSFNYCRSLTTITIPSSVTSIGTACFSNSPNLKEIIINKEEGSISGSPWGCMYGDRVIKWMGE